MSEATKVQSHFSNVSGSEVRHVYSEDGKSLLGVIYKEGKGKYRIHRMDGKIRHKDTLQASFKTIRRAT